jgi:hypothetical protein
LHETAKEISGIFDPKKASQIVGILRKLELSNSAEMLS